MDIAVPAIDLGKSVCSLESLAVGEVIFGSPNHAFKGFIRVADMTAKIRRQNAALARMLKLPTALGGREDAIQADAVR